MVEYWINVYLPEFVVLNGGGECIIVLGVYSLQFSVATYYLRIEVTKQRTQRI